MNRTRHPRDEALTITGRRIARPSAIVLAAAMLAACGGGGSSSAGPGNTPPTVTPSSALALGFTVTGTQALSNGRKPQGLASTPVTVSLNGTVVGTGNLDANGHAKISFTAPVPPGSTVTITAGSLTVTTTLAMTNGDTAVLVTVNADGTLTVRTAADADGNGMVDPNDPEQETEDEDGHGNVSSVSSADGNVLPANAPFSLTSSCATITLTPTNPAVAALKFEEKGSDGESDDSERTRYEGPFTTALQFTISVSEARVHIEIFNAQHARIFEVKAPITAFTSGANRTSTPCPSGPSATPSTAPSGSPEPSESPEPSGSPEASESPSASPSPAG